MKDIAKSTSGFSGADLANVVNEAALLAVRAGRNPDTGLTRVYDDMAAASLNPADFGTIITYFAFFETPPTVKMGANGLTWWRNASGRINTYICIKEGARDVFQLTEM